MNKYQIQPHHIQHLAELDKAHTQYLASAVKRVYVKAQCPVSETAAPSGMDGSRPARLEKDAEQDYVRLLGELETLEAQYVGLRDYVKIECGREK
ncbi:lysis system i-spanin subunit Rz [Xenorhabdus littoralis]|uniref:lysis system i-spanin subunit Rz n=1 Tax=Xenorhabdus littoralis TaxID=2582835 RepID=UPI003B00B7B3